MPVVRRVITYGTFDLLHRGHVNILRRARALGDHLTVGLSSDDFNRGKGKEAWYPFEERRAVLEAIRYVDAVIPENTWEQKAHDIVRLGIDVFVMGDDWAGHFDDLLAHCEVVYLPRTEGISTTKMKEAFNELGDLGLHDRGPGTSPPTAR